MPSVRYSLNRLNGAPFTSMNEEWVQGRIARLRPRKNTATMRRRDGSHPRANTDGPAASDQPSVPLPGQVGDLDYELALLAVADSAAASLAAGRTDARDPALLAAAIAEECGAGPAAVSLALLTRIALSPKLLVLPTERAIELQLGTLASLAGLTRVSLWSSALGRITRRFALGRGAGGAVEQAVVERRLGARRAPVSPAEDRLVSAMVLRVDTPVAVVVGYPAGRPGVPVEPFLSVACNALGLVLEREALLQRGSDGRATLVAAHERRLTRLAFDLHDGPLQEIAVMAADLHAARSRMEETLPPLGREQVVGSFDDLLERLRELDCGLREVAHSLETHGVIHHPLAEVLGREVAAFERKTGITVQLSVSGEVDELTDSQKIALLRVVQEGLTNIREHSDASLVTVTLDNVDSSTRLEIVDDGRGFDVESELVAAARRGRLGLVGASERISLLGGVFTITSAPGGETRLVVSLPRWQS